MAFKSSIYLEVKYCAKKDESEFRPTNCEISFQTIRRGEISVHLSAKFRKLRDELKRIFAASY